MLKSWKLIFEVYRIMKFIQISFLFSFFTFPVRQFCFFFNVSLYIRFEFNPVPAVLFLDSAGALKMYYTHASS